MCSIEKDPPNFSCKTKAMSEEDFMIHKRQRQKAYSKKSRDKKKRYVKDLELRVEQLEEKIAKMGEKISELERDKNCRFFEAENIGKKRDFSENIHEEKAVFKGDELSLEIDPKGVKVSMERLFERAYKGEGSSVPALMAVRLLINEGLKPQKTDDPDPFWLSASPRQKWCSENFQGIFAVGSENFPDKAPFTGFGVVEEEAPKLATEKLKASCKTSKIYELLSSLKCEISHGRITTPVPKFHGKDEEKKENPPFEDEIRLGRKEGKETDFNFEFLDQIPIPNGHFTEEKNCSFFNSLSDST